MEYFSTIYTQLFPSLLALIFASMALLIFHSRRNGRRSELPPGTTGFPIIGETMEYGSSGPERFIRKRMEKHSAGGGGGVFRTSLLGEKMAVFCGPAGNRFLFSNENKSLTTWWPEAFRRPLTFPLPRETTLKEATQASRGLLLEFLRPESLKRCIRVMDLVSRERIRAEWEPFEEVKVYPLSKKITFSLACRLFLGMEDPNLVETLRGYFDLVERLMISVPVNLPGTAYHKAMRVGKMVKEEIVKVIVERKKEVVQQQVVPGQEKDHARVERVDFLSHILTRPENSSAQSSISMNEKDICNIMTSVLLATYDDTSAAVTFVLKFLAELPHIYNEVYKECMDIASSKAEEDLLNWNDIQKMKYSWNVARETLRLIPPSPGTYREVITDLTYAGFTVPKGWKTFWSVYSTHKDPKYFSDPDKFDPFRFEGSGPEAYTFVPFGGGSRMCPGREYARMEILVFVYNVVTRFQLEKLDRTEKLKYHVTPFPERGFPVRLIPHQK